MIDRLRRPDSAGVIALWVAAAIWAGAAAGSVLAIGWSLLPAAAAVLPWVARRHRVVAVALALGIVSGALAAAEQDRIISAPGPEGTVTVSAVAMTDGTPGRFGAWLVARPVALGDTPWPGPPFLAGGDAVASIAVGEVLVARGNAADRGGVAAGHAYGWQLRVRAIESGPAGDPVLALANAARSRVSSALEPFEGRAGAALIAGFLIGDERRLSELDREAMRRSGLSHFTAVSGSNVALFLGAVWLVLGPLAFGSRARAIWGLCAVVVFAAITRWEPSVLRASVMAGVVLGTRALALAISTWTALGTAVALILLVSGELAADAGFQLSVAAACGVIAGATALDDVRPRWLGRALAVPLAAQVAVAPILIWRFGGLPLWAPLINLVAAPLVAVATALGVVGVVLPIGPVLGLAVWVAEAVLALARAGSGLPQVSGWAMVGVAAVGAAFTQQRLRPLAAAACLGGALVSIVPGAGQLPAGSVAFLDVGQGDAAIVRGLAGETVVIDGGPDPLRLDDKLRARGIDRVDLLIVSHSHRDHVAGLEAVVGRRDVRAIWHSNAPDPSGSLAELLETAQEAGVAVGVPIAGTAVRLGTLELEVLAPLRRYASPNDQSLVVRIGAGGPQVVFTGDIEKIAQAELDPPEVDILKVPHQGAATSDPEWLVATGARLAVVSVGPNDYGHPDPELLAEMATAGMQVARTDLAGDIVVSLQGP